MIEAMAGQALTQISKAVVGREQTGLWCMAAMLSGGHILLEDIPGVGKTSLALALSETLGLTLGRVQFTSDVMPADVVGYCVPRGEELVYKPGPVQCNLFLADELNRATSRTQSALLEAMEEDQVTVDGVCHKLPQPFVVVATQNPLGGPGTQALPDNLLDRFSVRLRISYPQKEEEVKMLLRCIDQLQQVTTAQELIKMQEVTAATYMKETVAEYAVRLMAATRKSVFVIRGGSPRATLSVVALAKAWARLQGRDFVTPEDVKAAFLQAVPHRILARGNECAAVRRIARWVRPPKVK